MLNHWIDELIVVESNSRFFSYLSTFWLLCFLCMTCSWNKRRNTLLLTLMAVSSEMESYVPMLCYPFVGIGCRFTFQGAITLFMMCNFSPYCTKLPLSASHVEQSNFVVSSLRYSSQRSICCGARLLMTWVSHITNEPFEYVCLLFDMHCKINDRSTWCLMIINNNALVHFFLYQYHVKFQN